MTAALLALACALALAGETFDPRRWTMRSILTDIGAYHVALVALVVLVAAIAVEAWAWWKATDDRDWPQEDEL